MGSREKNLQMPAILRWMSFKRHKQSALPNKNYPLNANTKYNWSLRSFDWLIFERHSLPEFILVGIYETFL